MKIEIKKETQTQTIDKDFQNFFDKNSQDRYIGYYEKQLLKKIALKNKEK